jgi:hypothetical protein
VLEIESEKKIYMRGFKEPMAILLSFLYSTKDTQ